ncbi:MAG: protealysin inhibitor emfourin [Terrimesophilobacter sp.]
MKITVVRSGGILGTPRQWEVIVDDQDDPESWLMLVRELPWHEAQQAPAAPDRYVYRISCARRKVTLPEQQVVGRWRELVERVQGASG